MASHPPKVPGLFPPPCREDTLKAISRALLRIRSDGWSRDALARQLDCSADTIDSASNEKSLLSFDSIALLAFYFPEEFSLVEALWNCRATTPPTIADRLDRIDREAAAIRKELV